MAELWRKIEQHLPGAKKRAYRRAWGDGFSPERNRINPEGENLKKGIPVRGEDMDRHMFNDYDIDRS